MKKSVYIVLFALFTTAFLIYTFIVMSPSSQIQIWRPDIYGKFGDKSFAFNFYNILFFLGLIVVITLTLILIFKKEDGEMSQNNNNATDLNSLTHNI